MAENQWSQRLWKPLEGTSSNPRDLNGQERSICLCHHNHSNHETFAAEIWHSRLEIPHNSSPSIANPNAVKGKKITKKYSMSIATAQQFLQKKIGVVDSRKKQHFYSTFPSFPWRLPISPPPTSAASNSASRRSARNKGRQEDGEAMADTTRRRAYGITKAMKDPKIPRNDQDLLRRGKRWSNYSR